MIDTHTHLYYPECHPENPEYIKCMIDEGVNHVILPNVDVESIPLMREFHSKYPGLSSMAMGLHPTEVKENYIKALDIIEKELSKGEYCAVGEVGMDLYWDTSFLSQEKDAFEQQLKFAQSLKIPVIIHCRNALNETLDVVEKVAPEIPLIFHSFTGSTDDIIKIRKICDPYFGINGVVTYKNAGDLRKALTIIQIDKILLETDSPYLTPVPYRGKPNHSIYLKYIRDKVAETIGVSPEEIDRITEQTSRSLFGI